MTTTKKEFDILCQEAVKEYVQFVRKQHPKMRQRAIREAGIAHLKSAWEAVNKLNKSFLKRFKENKNLEKCDRTLASYHHRLDVSNILLAAHLSKETVNEMLDLFSIGTPLSA